jgi:outer membrane lipoprotein SlyB
MDEIKQSLEELNMSKSLTVMTSFALTVTATPALAIDPTQPSAPTATASESRSSFGGANGMGIFGCSADGNKQIGVAAVGGLLGGFLGNRIAGRGSRTLGTLLGAGIGAAAGSALGCKLQKNDRVKAERSVENAVTTGKDQSWQSDETGASGKVEVTNAGLGSGAALGDLKFAKGVEPASGYSKIGKAYQTTATANLRSRPGLDGTILGQVKSGTRVWVPASVQGSPWYLVSDNGTAQGYLSNALLAPAVAETAANSCKMVKQTINMPGSAAESESYQACKGANGEWVMTRV